MKKTTLSALAGAVIGILTTAALVANAQQGDPDMKVNGSPVVTEATSSAPPPTAGTFVGTVTGENGDFGGQAGANALCASSFGAGNVAVLEETRLANALHPSDPSGMFATLSGVLAFWIIPDDTYPFSQIVSDTNHYTDSCAGFTYALNDRRANVLFTNAAGETNYIQVSRSNAKCDSTSTAIACFTP